MKSKESIKIFVVIFIWSGIVFGYGMYLTNGQAVGSIAAGVVCGLLFAFFAVGTLPKGRITIPLRDKQAFIADVHVHLAQLGYYLEAQTDTSLTYAPHSKVEKRTIVVQLKEHSATIFGPKGTLKRLAKRLLP